MIDSTIITLSHINTLLMLLYARKNYNITSYPSYLQKTSGSSTSVPYASCLDSGARFYFNYQANAASNITLYIGALYLQFNNSARAIKVSQSSIDSNGGNESSVSYYWWAIGY